MKTKLLNYLDELTEEYQHCVLYDEELTEARSDNYFYHTRARTLLEVIISLYEIIEKND